MNELSMTNDTTMMIFDDSMFLSLDRVADMMMKGTVMVPDHIRKSKGDCFAVAMQAAQWGMNPFAVAQKTFLVSGTLGYEAQLVNAVVSTSTAIEGRFHYKYGGDWPKILGIPGKKIQVEDKFKPGQKKWITVKGWKDADEAGLFVQVGATIADEEEICWGEEVYMATQEVRNSPLWTTDPKQQLGYLAVKKWARTFTPGVILGVYTPDELQEKDITPVAFEDLETDDKVEAHKAKVSKKKTPAKKKAPIESTAEEVEPEPEMSLEDFIIAVDKAGNGIEMSAVAAKGAHFVGAEKAKASKHYKARVAVLKKSAEPEKEEAQPEESRSINEAYNLLSRSKTIDDLEVATEHVMKLSSEKKITVEEIGLFDDAYQKRFAELDKA